MSPMNIPRLNASPRSRIAVFALPAVLTFSALCLPAESADAPSGPLLAPIPDFSQWVVTFTYPEEKPRPGSLTPPPTKPDYFKTRVRSVTTTKTHDIVHEAFVDEQGQQSDVWHVGNTQYQKPLGSSTWQQHDATELSDKNALKIYSPLPASGFRDLDWITPENYVTTIKNGDRSYLVFVPNPPPNLDLSNPDGQAQKLDNLVSVALIDATTHLPFQVTFNQVTRSYRFDPPPTEVQALPSDLVDAIQKGQQGRIRLAQPAPRPY